MTYLTISVPTKKKRLTAHSLSIVAIVTSVSAVPSALATSGPVGPSGQTGPNGGSPESGEFALVDTGISKLRSGKAVIRAAMPKLSTDRQALRLSLDGFRVEGDPRLAPEALNDILKQWRGKELSFSEYEEAIHAVAQYLRTNGHPDAQVKMSRAVLGNGQVAIAIEGLAPNVPAIASAEIVPKLEIQGFKVTGATIATEEELQVVLAEFAGKPLTMKEMELAAQSVANHLRAKGYPLVQAYLPPQRVDGGLVEIAVQEGRLDPDAGNSGVTVVSAGERVITEILEQFIASGTKPGQPLRMADLERGVLLASDLAGIKSVKTQIEPGMQPGSTQIKATVEETPMAIGTLSSDNFGSRYTGTDRVQAQLLINSPFEHGEQLGLNLVQTSDSQNVKLTGSLPVGTDGLRLGASYMDASANFGLEQVTIDLSSKSTIWGLNAAYPLIRSAQTNLNLSGGYEQKHFITDLTWGRENDRTLDVLTLALGGDFIDPLGGQVRWQSSLATGRADLSAHKLDEAKDATNAKTAGSFSKLNWQASRFANIDESNRWSWLASFSGQWASKNLDSAEKFQLGGPNGVRAYPVSEGIGDHGWLASAELRYRLPDTPLGDMHLFGFADSGGVTQYARTWTVNGAPYLGNRPNSYTLSGAGLGASAAIGDAGNVKIIWARKIGSNPNPTPANTDSDGQSKNSRIWIVGNIVF